MRIQIAKAAFWGITALLAVALAGLLGYFQGFAHTIGITDLDRSISQLIADGTQMIRDVPNHVFGAGLASTGEWLIAIASLISAAAFFAIALLSKLILTFAFKFFTMLHFVPLNRFSTLPFLSLSKTFLFFLKLT